MSRVDSLPENRITELLKSLQDDAEQFKNSEFISGRLGYLVQTGSTWDATASLTGTNIVNFTVAYTGDNNHPYPFTHYLFDLFIDVPNNEVNRVNYADPSYINGSNTVDLITLSQGEIPDYPSHDEDQDGTARRTMIEAGNQMKWIFSIFTSGSVTYYFKAYAFASDTGSLSVSVS